MSNYWLNKDKEDTAKKTSNVPNMGLGTLTSFGNRIRFNSTLRKKDVKYKRFTPAEFKEAFDGTWVPLKSCGCKKNEDAMVTYKV